MIWAEKMAEPIWGIDSWGPEMARVWGGIRDADRRLVKAYGFSNIPETIHEVPCAISYLFEPLDVEYSLGNRNLVSYHGKTEFFLSTDVTRGQLGRIFPYVKKIIEAAAQNISLNGKVDSFEIRKSGGIEPAILNYGDGIDRFGLVVSWDVYETITGKIVVHE